MNKNTLRILITDDHATTRLGIKQILKQILKEEFKRVVLGEAADGAGMLRQLREDRWDLLILDISLPGRDGLDLLREVKQKRPELPVLIFSVHPEDQFGVRAIKLGAAGYLAKERAPEELAGAVRKALSGGIYVTPLLGEHLAGNLSARAPSLPHETLSDREFQVLRLTASGKAGKAIAAELGLSQKTVSTYRTRLLKKLDLKTTAELIQYALRYQLVTT